MAKMEEFSLFYYNPLSNIPINTTEDLRKQSEMAANLSNYPPWSLFTFDKSKKNPSFQELLERSEPSLENNVDETNSLRIETGAKNIDPRFGIYGLDENPNSSMATRGTFNNRLILGLPWVDPRISNGVILMWAKDQNCCRILENINDEGNIEDIDFMFTETIRYIRELTVHRIGSSFVQKLLAVCNNLYITQILSLMVSDPSRLLEICSDYYGSVTIQKLVDYLSMHEQRLMLVSALGHITLDLLKNHNGYQVVQYCLMSFDDGEITPILNVMVDNCLEIAKDKIGCFILQLSLMVVRGDSWNCMVNQIIDNAYDLSKDPHGNYVVQKLMSLKIQEINDCMLSQFSKKFISLSINKFGSNVMETIFKVCDDDVKEEIMKEFMQVSIILRITKHPFGNFVAQAALMNLRGNIRNELASLIMSKYRNLQNHPYGKNVLEKASLINLE